ncbi:unnamed protein product [Prunus armeniaca]|uniref:Uncharacterized protein n=1 Tax=Prunus armeniaca TaxID=36596 RepID=A0A6J5VDK5_PRUAR|nr:unnamed protein product [Prunus armeniaca]
MQLRSTVSTNKIVNFGTDIVNLKIVVDGLELNSINLSESTKTVLMLNNPMDENSFNEPKNISESTCSQMPRHLISDAHEWINEIPTVPVYYPAKPQPRERAWQNQRGKKTLLSLTLKAIVANGLPLGTPTWHHRALNGITSDGKDDE